MDVDATTSLTSSASLCRPRRPSLQGTNFFAQGSAPRVRPFNTTTTKLARGSRASRAPKAFQILEDEALASGGDRDAGKMASYAQASPVGRGTLDIARAGIAPGRARRQATAMALHSVREESAPHILSSVSTQTDSATSSRLRHEPRRRTIFVPSEDTTLLSIHPGMNGPREETLLLCGPSTTAIAASPEVGAVSAAKGRVDARVRRPARTSILAAPKRAPLLVRPQHPHADVGNGVDRNGSLTGKENIAPGSLMMDAKTTRLALASTDKSILRPRSSNAVPMSKTGSTASCFVSAPCSTHNASQRTRTRTPMSFKQIREKVAHTTKPVSRTISKKPRLELANHPMLQEDVSHAQLFEESWLSNQECVLVELINGVFARYEASRQPPDHQLLRKKLSRLHQQRSNAKLHQRLQASIQFGTLSVPPNSDCEREAHRYAKDVGRRQRFIRLWTQSYSSTFLRAGMEAIIGRQIKAHDRETCTSRDLTLFVEGFLLANEDSEPPVQLTTERELVSWAWRRTLLRSLMLVYLLDQAKETLQIKGNLMRSASSFKTSTAVLTELADVLHPSERNMAHCLSHLGLKLTYAQPPLADFAWPITNLATGLRDGIRLARLIELLLPLSCQPTDTTETGCHRSSLASSSSAEGSTRFSILPHLRIPSPSRAAMLANNELVLDSLRVSSCICDVPAAEEVSAADLVDGHRERTLALCWGILGTAGVECLVDWDDVRVEIVRLGGEVECIGRDEAHHHGANETEVDRTDAPAQRRTEDLFRWTRLIAEKAGRSMFNESSAFADGCIFEAVVDAYAPFIVSSTSSSPEAALSTSTATTSPSSNPNLEIKLLRLGTSPSFASLLAPRPDRPRGHFTDQSFVHATLLFLAARLLPASRPERVRRAALHRLARDCATVVQTRLRMERAASVIQRTWRQCGVRRRQQQQQQQQQQQKRQEVKRQEEKRQEQQKKQKGDRERKGEAGASAVKRLLRKEVDVDFWLV